MKYRIEVVPHPSNQLNLWQWRIVRGRTTLAFSNTCYSKRYSAVTTARKIIEAWNGKGKISLDVLEKYPRRRKA